MTASIDLDGRCAIVTGAASGLGRFFAGALAGAGAQVVVAARRTDRVEKVAQEIERDGGKAIGVTLDVTKPDSVNAAIAEAESAFGPVRILINNAGAAVTKPVLEVEEADWDKVVDTNLKGAWLMAQAAARNMAAHGLGGSIVNIGSVGGIATAGYIVAYAASKAGLHHLTRVLAWELAEHRIRVNAMAPGYISTELNADFLASKAGRALRERVPQRRFANPEDLEGLLLLLASDASSFMTGAVIPIDGGLSIRAP